MSQNLNGWQRKTFTYCTLAPFSLVSQHSKEIDKLLFIDVKSIPNFTKANGVCVHWTRWCIHWAVQIWDGDNEKAVWNGTGRNSKNPVFFFSPIPFGGGFCHFICLLMRVKNGFLWWSKAVDLRSKVGQISHNSGILKCRNSNRSHSTFRHLYHITRWCVVLDLSY